MKILISVPDHHGREFLEAVLSMKDFEKHVVVIDEPPSKQELAEIIKESEAIKYIEPPRFELLTTEVESRRSHRRPYKYHR